MNADIPDRGSIGTEQRNQRTMALHRAGVSECVRLLNDEDATVAAAVARAAPALVAFIERAEQQLGAGGRLIYIGAGTSGRLGVLDAAECPPTFQSPPEQIVGLIAGGDASLRRSSESREDERDGAVEELAALGLREHDALLGVAAGGTTPYVLGALEYGRSTGCATGLLTCAPMERPAYVDHLIVIDTGPEAITGSTRMKAGTATKMALNTISTTLMVRAGKVYQNLMVDLRATNAKLRDRAARIVIELTGLDRAAACALLDRAGGGVKAAVVMHRLTITRDEAERLLARHDGRLDLALGEGAQG